jgi:5-methylcytosine-specific restriction endonuclease McrA
VIRVKMPKPPDKLPQAADDELERLKKKLRDGERLGTKDFKAYKAAGVREALNACFAFKCAYCESFFGGTQPVAIEHYRPKSEVTTEAGPVAGYYWLAAKWVNLLPSCTDCNSQRTHVVAGQPVTMGKANQFPLSNEARRAHAEGEERLEGRLLLHPYLDWPERHLQFVEGGIVQPRATSGRASSKGSSSILVYALLRPGLVQARQERQLIIRAMINLVDQAAQEHHANPTEARGRKLDDGVAALRELCKDAAPYSQMARQMIEPFMQRLLR